MMGFFSSWRTEATSNPRSNEHNEIRPHSSENGTTDTDVQKPSIERKEFSSQIPFQMESVITNNHDQLKTEKCDYDILGGAVKDTQSLEQSQREEGLSQQNSSTSSSNSQLDASASPMFARKSWINQIVDFITITSDWSVEEIKMLSERNGDLVAMRQQIHDLSKECKTLRAHITELSLENNFSNDRIESLQKSLDQVFDVIDDVLG